MVKLRKIIQCVAIACVAIMLHADEVLQPSYMSYAQIADRYVKPLTQEKYRQKQDSTAPNMFFSTTMNNAITRAKQAAEKMIGLREQKEVLFNLLSSQKMVSGHATYSPLETVAYDLNFFSYKSKNMNEQSQHLFSKINRTETIFGEAYLAHMLANPIRDIEKLKKRQKIIRALVNDDALFKDFETIVNKIKAHQEGILSNYVPVDPGVQDFMKNEFYGSHFLNTSPYVNETVRRVPTGVLTIWFGHRLWSAKNAIQRAAIVGGGALGYFGINKVVIPLISWMSGMDIVGLQKAMHSNLMFKGVQGAATLANEIECIEEKRGLVSNGFLNNYDNREYKQGFSQLKSLFKTSTFAGAPVDYAANWAFHGRLRAAYYLMQQHKSDLMPYMHMIGEIDAYLSIAKLYKEHQKEGNARYSFVDFVQDENPLFEAQNFWNPMLAADKAVTNSLTMGGNEPRVITVTGSNTGGKSTIVSNGLALMVMLAQTLGIAPVQSLKMRPFDYIATFMKVEEDIVDGNSRYHAEIKAAAKIQKDLRTLPKNATAAVFVDEAFTGTNEQSGSKALYSFASDLMSNKKVLAAIVTHYKKITSLEQKSQGECKNYKVDVSVNGNEIKRPYKLEPGVSEVNIADELYRNEQKNESVSETY